MGTTSLRFRVALTAYCVGDVSDADLEAISILPEGDIPLRQLFARFSVSPTAIDLAIRQTDVDRQRCDSCVQHF